MDTSAIKQLKPLRGLVDYENEPFIPPQLYGHPEKLFSSGVSGYYTRTTSADTAPDQGLFLWLKNKGPNSLYHMKKVLPNTNITLVPAPTSGTGSAQTLSFLEATWLLSTPDVQPKFSKPLERYGFPFWRPSTGGFRLLASQVNMIQNNDLVWAGRITTGTCQDTRDIFNLRDISGNANPSGLDSDALSGQELLTKNTVLRQTLRNDEGVVLIRGPDVFANSYKPVQNTDFYDEPLSPYRWFPDVSKINMSAPSSNPLGKTSVFTIASGGIVRMALPNIIASVFTSPFDVKLTNMDSYTLDSGVPIDVCGYNNIEVNAYIQAPQMTATGFVNTDNYGAALVITAYITDHWRSVDATGAVSGGGDQQTQLELYRVYIGGENSANTLSALGAGVWTKALHRCFTPVNDVQAQYIGTTIDVMLSCEGSGWAFTPPAGETQFTVFTDVQLKIIASGMFQDGALGPASLALYEQVTDNVIIELNGKMSNLVVQGPLTAAISETTALASNFTQDQAVMAIAVLMFNLSLERDPMAWYWRSCYTYSAWNKAINAIQNIDLPMILDEENGARDPILRAHAWGLWDSIKSGLTSAYDNVVKPVAGAVIDAGKTIAPLIPLGLKAVQSMGEGGSLAGTLGAMMGGTAAGTYGARAAGTYGKAAGPYAAESGGVYGDAAGRYRKRLR